MPDSSLLLDIADGVAVITLNRPQQRNALTRALAAALREAVGDIGRSSTVRAVLLRAAGDHFMVGADIKWMAAGR